MIKQIVFLSGLVSSLFTWSIILPALSQVTSDGTTNTSISPNGSNFDILDGIQKGNNLFHSFKEFSIPQGSSAIFKNSTDIVNIINRVTGGNISNIDGLIKANGSANLFLINPAGIVFGENASLNIGGSFFATTAESILFKDGFEFSAVNPKNQPLLTVSVPLGLQMGSNPGKIEVQGSGHQIIYTKEINSFIRDERPLGLQVPSGKTLALIGGDISLQGGNLTAEAGRVELGSVLESAKVELIPTSDGFTTGYKDINQFGDINLFQAASVEVSGEGGGNIQLQGRQISALDDSVIIANTLGTENGALFSVKASESVEIIGSMRFFNRGFFNEVEAGATGNGGNINIETPQLNLDQFSVVSVNTQGEGNAGNITLKVDNLTITEKSQVGTVTFAGGNGGDLTIIAADSVDIAGSSTSPSPPTGLFSSPTPGSTGDGGNITIETPQLSLVQDAVIYASTESEGNSGNITLKVDNLALRNGGRIITGTFADGNGGDLTIIAADSVDIAGPNTNNSSSPTGLFSYAVKEGSKADAGNIIISTPQFFMQQSNISARTRNDGNAGSITLKVDNLTMRDNSIIQTDTFSGGNGGDLSISAAKSIEVTDSSFLVSDAEEGSTGDAGNITISTPQFFMQDSTLSALAYSEGNAGNINLKVNNLALNDSLIVTGTFAGGNGGDLTVSATESIKLTDSGLYSNAVPGSTGDAGNMTIDTPQLSLVDSSIFVRTIGSGDAGNLNMTTSQLSLVQESNISASTRSEGNAGSITLKVDNLTMRDSSTVQTATYAAGNGGDLTIIAADSIDIAGFREGEVDENDGSLITFFPTAIYSVSAQSSTGNAGNLNISSKQINIRDQGRIMATNFGTGNAGDLTINADTIFVDNQAGLEAGVVSGDRGNINLTSQFIQLRRQSGISTNATGTANGGNININSPVIAGFENSDIVANAVEGNGGEINITTQGLFGLQFRDQLTDKSDITASSEFGINGTVQINNVGIEPSSGLVELPELINTDVVIANSCVARSRKQDSTFYITSKAGFPYAPGEAVPSDYSMFEVRALSDNTSLKTSASPRKQADSIVEATGIYRLENGELVFGRECEK